MWTKIFVLNCILVLSLVASIRCTNEEDLACFKISDSSKTDPRAFLPTSRGTAPGKPNPDELTRHHIIPYEFLRTFFNFAATADVGATVRTAINQEIRHLVDSYVDKPSLISSEVRQKVRAPTEHETVIRAMKLFYSWMPGNIFFGPKTNLRSDDPGSAFEVDCYEIIGDENYKKIGNLYIQMVNFVDSTSHRTADVFRSIVTDLITLFNRREPYPYNKAQWEVDPTPGRGSKCRIHLAERQTLPKTLPKVPKQPKQPAEAAGADCFAPKLVDIVTDPFAKKFKN